MGCKAEGNVPQQIVCSPLHSLRGARLTYILSQGRWKINLYCWSHWPRETTPITYWVLQAIIKPCWIKHAHHVLGPMRPREGGAYCFGCMSFCGAIGLRETKRVAVLGRGVLVEMKPIYCDCKTKPLFGGYGAEGNINQIVFGSWG